MSARDASAADALAPGDGSNATDSGPDSDAGAGPDAAIECDSTMEYTGNLPAGADPCTDLVRWPLALRSSVVPVVVRYSRCAHTATAAQVLGLVEQAWQIETGPLGFSAPLPDGGRCGDDDSFDVFLWPDKVESYVQALEPNPATPHDDWFTFMVLDPWGPYGGALLPSTVAHELNHACQAADDWWEHITAFEMTATFVEEMVHPADNAWLFVLDDFAANPDWSVDRDDGYQTWYMYGAALLLHFVRERYFAGDASFAGTMWRQSRNPPGDNEPDFLDALDALLRGQAGIGFSDAVGELAAWRWYTGGRDDGQHFAEGALYPQPAVTATVTATSASVAIDPMIYGTAYVDLVGTGQRAIALTGAAGVRWLMQAVPGTAGATSDILDPAGDLVSLDGFAERTLVITALPLTERDPDDQSDQRFTATIDIAP